MQTTRWQFRVKREDIHYLRTTIEAYDGMAVVRTADPLEENEPGVAIIELLIAPGCEDMISNLIGALREREGIRLERIPA
ncbi:MAG: DUF4911 domain-containing protein [Desulfobacterota bacterium]|nr:DUF4911 domain-containing protein [Thermodesulfobacteriota bacterium]